jgi:predicted O-methyltransferase YrrM
LTDKIPGGLDIIYKDMFKKYENVSIEFLEIGVASGSSLLMFKDMMPKANLYGIDIHVPNMIHERNIRLEEINQNDTEALQWFACAVGRFDVVIDDGSHFTKETKNCFDVFWKYVPEGGLYVIEDWAISFAKDLGYYQANKDKVIGMGDLVCDLTSTKGVKNFEIVANKKHSYAVYYK